MTYEQYVKQRSKEELKQELKWLNTAIDKVECFGTKDLILREYIKKELTNRD